MTDELVKYNPAEEEIINLTTQAEVLLKSGFLPVAFNTVAKIVAVGLAAKEMGIGLQQAVRSMHVVSGKVGLSTGLMLGLAYRRVPGFALRVVKSDNEECTVEVERKGGSKATVTFTMKDAIRAGLIGNEVWRKYPADMLFNRAASRALRIIAPDAIGGAYTTEEVTAMEGAASESATPLVGSNTLQLPVVNESVAPIVETEVISEG